jgi:hypothetical protein
VAQVAPARHVQSPAERKKDIVAQAMQEQKIFEENIPKAEPVVKQEPGVAAGGDATAEAGGADGKPAVVSATKSVANSTPSQRKPYQRTNTFNRQQVMPRLQVIQVVTGTYIRNSVTVSVGIGRPGPFCQDPRSDLWKQNRFRIRRRAKQIT